jgi:hypothetical protein
MHNSILLALLVFVATYSQADDTIIDIQSTRITESSGLAASNRVAGHFWTHNDSGDGPQLFAIDSHGVVTGSVVLEGATAIDWEDMASFVDGDSKRLLIADIGDNQAKRKSVTLYLLNEPDPREHLRTKSFQSITVKYPDGSHDCESIGVDVKRREVWLVTKSFLPLAQVYSMSLPNESADPASVTLVHRGTIAVSMVSAMDIDPRSGDVVLVNYVQCLRYKVSDQAKAGAWILQVPRVSELPKLKQIEAVAVDANGDVWVTSEGVPGKLSRLEIPK